MFRWNASLRALAGALLLASALVWAQTETQITTDQVRRVAKHISCQCGSCSEDANCMMSAGQCGFCKPARTKIFQMQQAGSGDDKIIASFIQEYGQKIFRADPNAIGWIIPYIALLLGGLVVVWFVRRSSRLQAAPASGPPLSQADLGKYRDEIEKDLAQLD
jgi:cytochrome c-type biogenesis protein CcmH/NrfF